MEGLSKLVGPGKVLVLNGTRYLAEEDGIVYAGVSREISHRDSTAIQMPMDVFEKLFATVIPAIPTLENFEEYASREAKQEIINTFRSYGIAPQRTARVSPSSALIEHSPTRPQD